MLRRPILQGRLLPRLLPAHRPLIRNRTDAITNFPALLFCVLLVCVLHLCVFAMRDESHELNFLINARQKATPARAQKPPRRGDCGDGVWREGGWGGHTRVRERIQNHQVDAAIHGTALGGIVRGGGIVFGITGSGETIGSQREFGDEELDDFGGSGRG
jgi:hypothetical protein